MNLEQGDWKAFEQWLTKLRSEYGERELLFRGQGDSQWPLDTTLERNSEKIISVHDYYRLIAARVAPAVETFTGISLPAYDPELAPAFQDINSFDSFDRFPSGPLYEYTVYLRHHSFPSPLLDWSKSPFVAAFFAFKNLHPKSGTRSIYAYCERPTGIKGGTVGEATIRTLGPYVRSHPRHFRQQSSYTVCESFDDNLGWRYDSHQKVFEKPRPRQDFLWRFDLQSEDRINILRLLNDYNLNAYSLFDSEEALLETMWLREQAFRNYKETSKINSATDAAKLPL